MPEDIIISEGGKGARIRNVSHIVTDDTDSEDFVAWVPQTDRLSTVKYISKNGTYKASDDGVHSWSKINVNVFGGAIGTATPTTTVNGIEVPTGSPTEYVTPFGIGSSVSGYEEEYARDYDIEVIAGVIMDPMTETEAEDMPTLSYDAPPDHLEVVKNPEREDCRDVVIRAMTAMDTVWATSNYPKGIIPFEELRITNTGTSGCTWLPRYPVDSVEFKKVSVGDEAHYGEMRRAAYDNGNGNGPVAYDPLFYITMNDELRAIWRRSSREFNNLFFSTHPDSDYWERLHGMQPTKHDYYCAGLAYFNGSYLATTWIFGAGFQPNDIANRQQELCVLRDNYERSTGNAKEIYPLTVSELVDHSYQYVQRNTLTIGGKTAAIIYSVTDQHVNPLLTNSAYPVEGSDGMSYIFPLGWKVPASRNMPINFADLSGGTNPANTIDTKLCALWNYLYNGPVDFIGKRAAWTTPYGNVLTVDFDSYKACEHC